MRQLTLNKTQQIGIQLLYEKLGQVQQLAEGLKKELENFLKEALIELGQDPKLAWTYDLATKSLTEVANEPVQISSGAKNPSKG